MTIRAGNSDLTPTMRAGLRKMILKAARKSAVMAEPNENTGKALEKRGLIEFVSLQNGWRHYKITDAGYAADAAGADAHG